MNTRQVDILNIGLIILSFGLAYFLPVRLFLFSYAVLGPLHYLTEIGWLDKRGYFAQRKKDIWILGFFTALLTAGTFLASSNITVDDVSSRLLKSIIAVNNYAGAGIVFFAFGAALAMVFIKKSKVRYLVMLLIAVVSLFVHKINFTLVLFGVLVPTIVHVSIFTMFFMLYGALRNKSIWGIFSVILFVLGCISIFFLHKNPSELNAPQDSLQMLLDSTFIHIGALFSDFIGLREPESDYLLLTSLGMQIQTLFAFCYTYHYLNWFSKTKVINWHEVSRRWIIITGIIWVASLALYATDYKTGFMALFFLSMLHVFFEFPLNHLSIVGIFQEIRKIAFR